ncbi:MAG: endonuclease/exonuclease/phosphatase family protein [Planctomycetota bacterium]|nr:endonuclease/exonuclease/phosphatase family protein [Planctomycetota bacterium]MDA1177875.1 endonuclease/exonuclease/phosphatase family protein [Planctomycetota bacterium]
MHPTRLMMKPFSFPRKRRHYVIGILLGVIFLPYWESRVGSSFRCISQHALEHTTPTHLPIDNGKVRLATYNIAHGRGTANSNWRGGDPVERTTRLDQIAELLRSSNADVVVLNEVDFDTSWSGCVNQAEYLAKAAGFPYWVEQRNIDFRVLLWKFRFGNAILSKHPVEKVQVVDLPEYTPWETWLAGKKRGVMCQLRVGERTLRLIGTHLEARSESVRVRSARNMIQQVAAGDVPVFVLGDLNSTPPNFPYSASDEHGHNAISIMDAAGLWQRTLQDDTPVAEHQLTFPSMKRRSVIDWIFIPQEARLVNYEVVDSLLSDHCPVVADIMPRFRG